MKAIIKMALAAMPLLLVACDDDVKEPGKSPAGEGDGIQFTISAGNESRTMYADDWDPETNKQDIYWGNYIKSEKDSIKIFCKNALDNQVAVYHVTDNQDANSNVAVKITNVGGDGANMRWGATTQTYNFYAFYPARQAGDALLDGSDHIISATVATGQSPTSYRAVKADNTVMTSLNDVLKNDQLGVTNRTVIYAQPDMSGAIMMAHKSVTGNEVGQPVSLNFNVLADVIDITLNGPISPNNLGGNAGGTIKSEEFINIQTVTLEAIDPATGERINKIISGSFKLDMSEGKPVEGSLSGNSTVQLQLASVENDQLVYPTMWVRVNKDKPETVADIDQMRLRAFLIPGQIENLNELQVRVMTNRGEYVQKLGDDAVTATGKIYPVKLGYFHNRGLEFDFSKWIGQLDPNIYISELSIPGSWHSANSYYQAVTDLVEQYHAGIRAFEVQTRNGTDLFAYHDFTKDFDASADDSYDTNTNYDDKTEITYVTTLSSNPSFNWGTMKYEATGTVMQVKTRTYYQKAKFSLRLYRTANDGATKDNSLSDALMDVGNVMRKDGLVFAELGMAGATGINAPIKKFTYQETRTKTNVTLTGTRSISGGGYTYNWENLDSYFTEADDWIKDNVNYPGITYSTIAIDEGEAWANAVDACLHRLATTENSHTGKTSYLYTGEITRNTTIGDVQGRIIVKLNTNYEDNHKNEGNYWPNPTPALFSRWEGNSGNAPMTVNMKWGGPVVPTPLEPGNDDLRWCYTELDNIDGWGSSLALREKAIEKINAIAYENYKGGLHRTFYENMIGGYVNQSLTAKNCQDVAKQLNSAMLKQISDPSRNACPLGLVFMNYAVDESNTYGSKDLIRAIINNNAAFLLNRKEETPGGTTGQSNVRENTNSSFVNDNDGLSPLR